MRMMGNYRNSMNGVCMKRFVFAFLFFFFTYSAVAMDDERSVLIDLQKRVQAVINAGGDAADLSQDDFDTLQWLVFDRNEVASELATQLIENSGKNG